MIRLTYRKKEGVKEMKQAGEILISQIAAYISEKVPVNIDNTKNELSVIMTNFHITKVEQDEIHPDLTEKIQWYLASMKVEGYSDTTIENYGLELRLFSDKVKKRVENITTADIRVYLANLKHIKMSTAGKKLNVIRSFFVWLTNEEIIIKNPAAKIKPPKIEKRLKYALTLVELELMRIACKTLRQRAFLEVFYATGCRLSEVHNLNKNDINVRDMSFRVIGKGNKERLVYLSERAFLHLERYLKTRNDDCVALMTTERKPYRRLSKRGIQCEIKKIAKEVGLDHKVSPHTMRRTFATLTLNNGADIGAVQELLGHSSPETTTRYAQTSESRKKEQHKRYVIQ